MFQASFIEPGTNQKDVISLVMDLSYLGSGLWQSRALPRFPEELNVDISRSEGRACTFFVLLHPNKTAGSTYLVIKNCQTCGCYMENK